MLVMIFNNQKSQKCLYYKLYSIFIKMRAVNLHRTSPKIIETLIRKNMYKSTIFLNLYHLLIYLLIL